jgi:hypothetical protein
MARLPLCLLAPLNLCCNKKMIQLLARGLPGLQPCKNLHKSRLNCWLHPIERCVSLLLRARSILKQPFVGPWLLQ